jgi:hypothetical protein
MKIIDIGICVNNVDPKGIGRIRYHQYGVLQSEKEKAITYMDWDENDPFIALPFLPHHINIIPQLQQSVKLIKYDTDKDTQNVEYISGPYSSPHDVQNQTFLSQHKDTTYGGIAVKSIKNIRNKNGGFNSPVTRGTMINNRDTGFRGNYGSDIIFSEDGVQLRGGMLISKQGSNKQNLLDYPQIAKKMGKLSLKKFPKTLKSIQEIIDSSKVTVSRLKYIVEYEIDNLTTPTELKLFIYKIVGEYGVQFNTDIFGENSIFEATNTSVVKLINTGNTISDATYIKSLDGTIKGAYVELRELLHLIDLEGLISLNTVYPNENIHPFYFRPTANFRLTKGSDNIEIGNKATFLSKIELRTKSGGSGLIYSKQNVNPPIIPNKKTVITSKEINGAGEQSFSNLSSDKIYITSTSPNAGYNIKTINFSELDEYELTQEDYLNKIEPNTYALVRGEILYNFLTAIVNILNSHIHNINEPLIKTDKNWEVLVELANSLKNDLLNDSIRIN